MHARKLPRISEPSFDKDYYNHSHSGKSNSANGGTNYKTSKMKFYKDHRCYSISPDIRNSPRDRLKDRERNRERDRDRERNRDRKYRDRDRNRDMFISPTKYRKESFYRDRSPIKDYYRSQWNSSSRDNSSVSKKTLGNQNESSSSILDSKTKSVKDWSEHKSSSGKKYYYNCITEVSQWEKPKEWIEYEKSKCTNYFKKHCDKNKQSQDKIVEDSNLEQSKSFKVSNKALTSQDMDISPHDFTPISENEDVTISSIKYSSENHITSTCTSNLAKNRMINSTGPSSVSAQEAIKTIQTALLLTSTGPCSIPSYKQSPEISNVSLKIDNQSSAANSPYSTPTHTEVTEKYQITISNNSCVPTIITTNSIISGSLTASSSSQMNNLICSSPITALKPQLPGLTPTLAKLYKEILISHVIGWPAESLEKASQRITEENNNIGNLAITRASAELKMARSLVRLAEIQATLQEQRILFLRQQSIDLDSFNCKRSINSNKLISIVSLTNHNVQDESNS